MGMALLKCERKSVFACRGKSWISEELSGSVGKARLCGQRELIGFVILSVLLNL